MSYLNDFDLDLKKVADNSVTGGSSYSSLSSLTSVTGFVCSVVSLTSEISIDICESMGNPTTGLTTGCCTGANDENVPQCI